MGYPEGLQFNEMCELWQENQFVRSRGLQWGMRRVR